jgi:hypothetical protein
MEAVRGSYVRQRQQGIAGVTAVAIATSTWLYERILTSEATLKFACPTKIYNCIMGVRWNRILHDQLMCFYISRRVALQKRTGCPKLMASGCGLRRQGTKGSSLFPIWEW